MQEVCKSSRAALSHPSKPKAVRAILGAPHSKRRQVVTARSSSALPCCFATLNSSATTAPDLPSDVVQHILLFSQDPKSAGRLACTNRMYHAMILGNTTMNHVWKEYGTRTWKRGVQYHDGCSFRQEFIRKYGIDQAAQAFLNTMAADLQVLPRLVQTMPLIDARYYLRNYEHVHWKSLLEYKHDVYDVCKNIMDETVVLQTHFEACKRFLASSVLYVLHRLDCHEQLVTWKTQQQAMMTPNRRAEMYETYGVLAALIAKSDEEVAAMPFPCPLATDVALKLDELAAVVRRVIRVARISSNDSVSMLRIVSQTIFGGEALGAAFQVSSSVYPDVGIDQVLETRSGHPMVVALIYLCVCRRLGVHLEMMNLARFSRIESERWSNIVLRLMPNNNIERPIYVDMFDQAGVVLTEQQLGFKFHSYPYLWLEERPMDPQLVVAASLQLLTRSEDYGAMLRDDLLALVWDADGNENDEEMDREPLLPTALPLRGLRKHFDQVDQQA